MNKLCNKDGKCCYVVRNKVLWKYGGGRKKFYKRISKGLIKELVFE